MSHSTQLALLVTVLIVCIVFVQARNIGKSSVDESLLPDRNLLPGQDLNGTLTVL